QPIADLAALIVELDIAAKLGGREERRLDDAFLKVADLELGALRRFEGCRGHPLAREQIAVDVVLELAVYLKRADRANERREPIVGNAVALLIGTLLEHRFADH